MAVAWPEFTRALAKKVTLEAEIEGGRPEERIVRLQQLANVHLEAVYYGMDHTGHLSSLSICVEQS